MRDLALVGAGTVGKALGRRLALAGWPIRALSCRTMESARAAAAALGQGEPFDDVAKAGRRGDVVLVAVPDDRLQEVTEALGRWGGVRKGAIVVHVSGAWPASAMPAVREAGGLVASMHPLMTFAGAQGDADATSGAVFACEGDEEALPVVREMVDAFGGRFLPIDGERKALYHAGAVMACNYLVTLVDVAAELLGEAGLSSEEAVRALVPLLRGTVANLEAVGLPRALTGPIARGDADTVEVHAREIASVRPDLLPLYQMLGVSTLPIAEEKGALPEGAAKRLARVLTRPRGRPSGRGRGAGPGGHSAGRRRGGA